MIVGNKISVLRKAITRVHIECEVIREKPLLNRTEDKKDNLGREITTLVNTRTSRAISFVVVRARLLKQLINTLREGIKRK